MNISFFHSCCEWIDYQTVSEVSTRNWNIKKKSHFDLYIAPYVPHTSLTAKERQIGIEMIFWGIFM